MPGKELSGGGVGFDIQPFAGTAPNITPDRETGIGLWSDDEIKRAITQGARPNHGPLAGKPLGDPMAANFFKALLPADLDAVVAYLRSIPAVRNATPPPVYRMPVKREAFAEAERGFTERDLTDKVRRGAYLATIAHCLECHTPMQQGTLLFGTALGAGGRPFLPSFVKGLPRELEGRGFAQHHAPSRTGARKMERRRDQARHIPGHRPRRPQARAADGLRLVRRHPRRGPRRHRRVSSLAAAAAALIVGGASPGSVERRQRQSTVTSTAASSAAVTISRRLRTRCAAVSSFITSSDADGGADSRRCSNRGSSGSAAAR